MEWAPGQLSGASLRLPWAQVRTHPGVSYPPRKNCSIPAFLLAQEGTWVGMGIAICSGTAAWASESGHQALAACLLWWEFCPHDSPMTDSSCTPGLHTWLLTCSNFLCLLGLMRSQPQTETPGSRIPKESITNQHSLHVPPKDWPLGPAGGATLKPKQLPQKQKTAPCSSGFCFSFLLLPLAQGHGRSSVGSGS